MFDVGFMPPASPQQQACSVFRAQLWRMQPASDSVGKSINITADVAIDVFLQKSPNCGASSTDLLEAWPCPADEIELLSEMWDRHSKPANG